MRETLISAQNTQTIKRSRKRHQKASNLEASPRTSNQLLRGSGKQTRQTAAIRLDRLRFLKQTNKNKKCKS
uniref:Uncharacterized protein n=1 Tax=Rhizophora mucronata TaxID=61149 RepID=A0A2P2MTE7_RHIMU